MRLKRWVLTGAIAAAACGYALLSTAQSGKNAACTGFGPPPGSPNFAKFEEQRAAEIKRTGYLMACEDILARYDVTSQLQPLKAMTTALQFRPLDLAGTPFSSFTNIGGLAEAVSNVNSRLYRSFRQPDGHLLTLFEHDMSADGTHSYRRPEDEPERINGLPARLMVLQATSGKAVSVLSWTEGRRGLELWINANVVLENKRAQFFALAASLPKSIPANAHEPESSPPMLGPDGKPVLSAPPAVIHIKNSTNE
ncbi:hypothetical protein H3H36_12110 [Duganella sp. FT3S]|uniref:Uncharacterized protein n=1 Tax=Rugamonas fusca TaxID=2758568 RepID=A0A7W2EHN8_9BURK|nr:hypothetical protein [Rugamonas fusca]MBA5606101.1 hypothetical protein [Rugamonas fusca]